LFAGVSIVSLDNVSADLGGDLLCQMTEQQLVRVRILGRSGAPEFECKTTLFDGS
jgi:putative DNA primase/helicase